MQTIYSFLGKLDHPLLIFSILGLRAGILGSSIGDALFLIGYLGFIGYKKYLENQRVNDLNEEVKAEIGQLKTMVATMGLKNSPKVNDIPAGKRYF